MIKSILTFYGLSILCLFLLNTSLFFIRYKHVKEIFSKELKDDYENIKAMGFDITEEDIINITPGCFIGSFVLNNLLNALLPIINFYKSLLVATHYYL